MALRMSRPTFAHSLAHSQLPANAAAPETTVTASMAAPVTMMWSMPLSVVPMLIISARIVGMNSAPATSSSSASVVAAIRPLYGLRNRNSSFMGVLLSFLGQVVRFGVI